MKDTTLSVAVEGGDLVVRVGVLRLDGHDAHPTIPKLKFGSRAIWAKEVISALTIEEEDGETPVSKLLDDAMSQAMDAGAIGISEDSATHVGTCELCGEEFAGLRHTSEGQVCASGCP